MISTRLDGKRVLLTQSNDFMGPPSPRFQRLGGEDDHGSSFVGSGSDVACGHCSRGGPIDVLLIHLALPAPSTRPFLLISAKAADVCPRHRPCRQLQTSSAGFSRWR